jgi:hypothetical protein
LRHFFEFTRGADENTRFDALMAGAAEHIATHYGRPGPLWTLTIDRFLNRPWWLSGLPSARAEAVLWTPASFRRRGIYLDRHDLTHDGAHTSMSEPLFDSPDIHRAGREASAAQRA